MRRVSESSVQATERKRKAKLLHRGAYVAVEKAYSSLVTSDDVQAAVATLAEDLAALGLKITTPKRKKRGQNDG